MKLHLHIPSIPNLGKEFKFLHSLQFGCPLPNSERRNLYDDLVRIYVHNTLHIGITRVPVYLIEL